MRINTLKSIFKSFFLSIFIIVATNSWAKAEGYCGFLDYKNTALTQERALDDTLTDAEKELREKLQQNEENVKKFCSILQKLNPSQDVSRKVTWWSPSSETTDDYSQRFEKMVNSNATMKKEYEKLKAEHEELTEALSQEYQKKVNEHVAAVASGEYIPCGSKFPKGCPAGKECYSKRSVTYMDSMSTAGTITQLEYDCLDPEDMNLGWLKAPKGNLEENEGVQTLVPFYSNKVERNELGEQSIVEGGVTISRGDNSACNIPTMQNMYQSSCYSCRIILTLITTFMNACGKVYDLTRDAGSKILVIGSMLWLAVFALKLVSSLTNQEPMSIVNDLFIFMFKVAAAYITINVGIGAIVDLFINPLLGAGADYGLGLLQAANQGLIKVALTSHYPYQGTEVISSNTIDKLMALTEGIDKTVSTNLVIGHALTCHAFHAGMITLFDPGKEFAIPVTIRMPDIWIWLCGAAIWFCGFCLTLAIGYYLLDVCFKIGFCVMALPIVIGLWPFGPTSSKFKACMSIIIRSSALFAFLALVVSYALSLVSASLGDLTLFYAKIKAGDAEWISNTFSIFGSSFLLILFAYIYSIHLTGKANDTTGTFFSDNVFGNASPIHHKMTQMTDFAKKTAMAPVKYAGGVVAHQATRAVGGMAKFAVNKAKGMLHSSKSNGGGAGGAVSGAGKGMKAAGQGVEAAGQGMQAAGKGMQAAGQGMKAAGQGITQASQAANAIPIAGQVVAAAGATAGAAVQAAGAATQAAGKGVEAAGKATKAAGKAVKKAGEATEAVGEATQNVENAVKGNSNKDKDEE